MGRKEHFVALIPEGPIRVGEVKPKGDYLGTRPYLPGSVLRGALAEWLKAQGREREIEPLVRAARFGNLFPSPSEGVYALPFPMTALTCKLASGFRAAASKGGHGVRDSLLLAVAYGELEGRGVRFPVPLLLRCTHRDAEGRLCGGRMERVIGFYARLPGGWEKVEVSLGLQTKVALSRRRRAAQEGMLYRVVALRPRPQGAFVGRLWAENSTMLSELCEAVAAMGVGGLTGRGFGAARLKVWPPEEKEKRAPLPPLEERVRTFNEKLREAWQDLAELAKQAGTVDDPLKEPPGVYFSVDLLAPAVLTDPQGVPSLKLWIRIGDRLLEPVWWATQPAFVGGFSTAWGLPKPTALGAAAGSVYVFRSELPEEELIPHLEALEAQGVGERTDEGLGEILVCHPFHPEVMPV